jgi:hypothetical protein
MDEVTLGQAFSEYSVSTASYSTDCSTLIIIIVITIQSCYKRSDIDRLAKSIQFQRYESKSELICKIRGFHGGDYEEWCLLGCYAVWLL